VNESMLETEVCCICFCTKVVVVVDDEVEEDPTLLG
jgi:hypothetical protein